MASARDISPIVDQVPWSDSITAYDEAHLVVYLRLLDASADGASQDEMAQVILGINPTEEPNRAAQAVDSHLRRARWMTQIGYRHLLTD
ncbi:MAG: DUF2285 domain-containing protein [Proteobacteria bacterium]|nr:DUF2285 domain-containing protein [Pseudomonadota bacterium]